jgi:hypothetical protein
MFRLMSSTMPYDENANAVLKPMTVIDVLAHRSVIDVVALIN